MRFLKTFLFLGVLSLLTSCGSESEPRESEVATEMALVNGQQVSKESLKSFEKAIVAITLHDRDGERISTCTGALIRPDVVLTAAHCFDPHFTVGFDHAIVHFLQDVRKIRRSDVKARSIRVRETVTHPSYDSNSIIQEAEEIQNGQRVRFQKRYSQFDHDLALGFLSQKAPADVKAASLISQDVPLPEEASITVYGFGRAIDFTDSQKSKRSEQTHTLQKATMVIGPRMKNDDRSYTKGQFEKALCDGDSGGPSFYIHPKKGPLLVAVSSASEGRLITPTFRKCAGGPSVLTTLPQHRDWIDFALSEKGAL